MKIKLSYFLSKRKTSLLKYCKDNSITDYETLVVSLREHRVKAPPSSEIDVFEHRDTVNTKEAKAPALAQVQAEVDESTQKKKGKVSTLSSKSSLVSRNKRSGRKRSRTQKKSEE